VHRPVGEQLEYRGTHVTAPAASAAARSAASSAAGAAWSKSKPGAEAAATWAEAAEAGTEPGLAAVFTDVVAEFASGLPAPLVYGSPVLGAEAESETKAGSLLEGVVLGGEWGVHVYVLLSTGSTI
jgi:hypothetical protein